MGVLGAEPWVTDYLTLCSGYKRSKCGAVEHCASLCESIPWNTCVLLLKIKKLKAQPCTPAVVSCGFSPEDSAWGRAGEAEDASAQVLTRGKWWQEAAQTRQFLLLFPLLPEHLRMPSLSVGEGECTPLMCSSHFQELPLF